MDEKVYTVDWYDERKTICLITSLQSNWTWDDAIAVVEEQVTLTETVEHPVHVIFHFPQQINIPRRGAFQTLPRLMENRAKNEDLGVFVGFHTLLSMLLTTAGKVYGLRNLVEKYRFVKTLDDAFAEIERYERERANLSLIERQ